MVNERVNGQLRVGGGVAVSGSVAVAGSVPVANEQGQVLNVSVDTA